MAGDTQTAFNLLDEPWIPVRLHDGSVREVGLKDAFRDARNYSGLAESSPPNLIALYRVLLAILHRALTTNHGAWKDADRARWFREGIPDAALQQYLEQWRERFWLIHPTHPFMQVAALGQSIETRDRIKPSSQIVLERVTGNAVVLFEHSLDCRPASMSFAETCRSLLGYLQFTTGGLVKVLRDSDKASPLANTAAIMPLGGNLGETLVLALHPHDLGDGDDLPSWECDPPDLDALKAAPSLASGANDRYTRLTRAVQLLPEGTSAEVRQIRFAAGRALEENVNAPDPMASYRFNRDGRPVRITFNEGRAVWRELPSLVPDASRNSDNPAAVLGWAVNLLISCGDFSNEMPILVAGLASDQAKLLRWRVERLVLPNRLLTNPDAAAELRAQVRFAEEKYRELARLMCEMVCKSMPEPAHKDTRARARTVVEHGPAASVFFSAAERALPLLMHQVADEEVDAAVLRWKRAIAEGAEDAWRAVGRSLGRSAASLRAEARVWPKFRAWLNLLNPVFPEAASQEAVP
jgi:CRISPR system Cascade subunit CasA